MDIFFVVQETGNRVSVDDSLLLLQVSEKLAEYGTGVRIDNQSVALVSRIRHYLNVDSNSPTSRWNARRQGSHVAHLVHTVRQAAVSLPHTFRSVTAVKPST